MDKFVEFNGHQFTRDDKTGYYLLLRLVGRSVAMNLPEKAAAKSSKVKSLRHIGKTDVYNMEVLKHHNFSINGGLIVHNCMDSDRYFTFTILGPSTKPTWHFPNVQDRLLRR